MYRTGTRLGALLFGCLLAQTAEALPLGPMVLCDTYAASPLCLGGQPGCTFCHVAPPERNVFGRQVAAALIPGAPRPLSDEDYMANLPSALRAVEDLDADGDGFTNLDEITAGTSPAVARSHPDATTCPPFRRNEHYDVCFYDKSYVFKKVNLDFCGRSPTFEELSTFRGLGAAEQERTIAETVDRCLDSEHWIGQGGVVWSLAHRKIRPLKAIKSGEGAGIIPLADYFDDYNLFVYTQIDGHDCREVLTADYFVRREVNPTRYTRVSSVSSQNVSPERRAGMLTTKWNLIYHVMFTALPRTAAAQAYRAYLGVDIAKLQGLRPIPGEPVDYDDKGVRQEACVVCHSTLDPLSYPFRNYDGLSATPFGSYRDRRIERYFADEAPSITQIPESGFVLGQPVNGLREWAEVAANSEEYAKATVMDYWKLLMGEEPRASESEEMTRLWRELMTHHDVERMLRDLVKTEAYGVP